MATSLNHGAAPAHAGTFWATLLASHTSSHGALPGRVSDATLAVQPSQRLNTISQAAVMSLFDPFVGGVLHGFDSLSLAALNGLEARLE